MEEHANSKYTGHFDGEGQATFSPGLQKLMAEHGPLLAEIEGLIQDIKSLDQVSEEMIGRHKQFLEALEHHSEKEERTLFVWMKQHLGTSYGPIEIMEVEHEEISKNLHAFLEKEDKQLSYLEKAFEVMQQHFFKEEHAIYPMAEEILSKEEMDAILTNI